MVFNKYELTHKKEDLDLNLDMFAQVGGVRGRQFGKDVYVTVLKFKDLDKFLESFPNVQRGMNKNRIKEIKKYILSAIGSQEESFMRFFNSVTVTCRGTMIYDEEKRTVLIDTQSKLSINDGQHRVEGIKEAIGELEKLIEKTKDLNDRRVIEESLEELKEMIVPVTIFNGLTEGQEGQLFHDLNNLPRRPSRNANIRLSQTDLFAKMSREVSMENKYLSHYGVEMDKQFITGNKNENTFLLSTVYMSIKYLLDTNLTLDKSFLKKKNYDRVKSEINKTFELILEKLPSDMDVKGKYVIDKSYTLTGICKFVSYANDNMLFADKEDIYTVIGKLNWSYKNKDWLKYGAIKGKGDNIIFSATSSGIKGIFSYLLDTAIAYNEEKEKSYIKN